MADKFDKKPTARSRLEKLAEQGAKMHITVNPGEALMYDIPLKNVPVTPDHTVVYLDGLETKYDDGTWSDFHGKTVQHRRTGFLYVKPDGQMPAVFAHYIETKKVQEPEMGDTSLVGEPEKFGGE